ncbi:hypothetical protein CDAR_182041 [Caerostris darwini]|uniref:Uncharacterized protein n=1 Tax=Caerostris darwini TaxID=1538125 RepID=A0AAV4MVK5_9ARAC|nr:hypothetical protein CDAR_182041 [Caerostris darwini]
MTHRNRNSPQSLLFQVIPPGMIAASRILAIHADVRCVPGGTRVPRNIPRESHWWVSAFVRREITEEERGSTEGIDKNARNTMSKYSNRALLPFALYTSCVRLVAGYW